MVDIFREITGPLYPVLDWPMNTGPNGGYSLTSGLGVAWILLVVGYARKHNCHHKGCKRFLRVHLHPEYGWPACKYHWNEKPEHVK